MDDANKQPVLSKTADSTQGPAASDEEQREMRERALLVEKLALRVLDECRVSLMLSFRYLDIALWKLPFVARQQNAALATDGTSLFFNPDLVVLRFKASPNELMRDYLQLVLHCVLRHPFETWRREPNAWSIACDMCVEAIAMEMCERLYPCADDEERADGLRVLRHEVDVLTPARVYRSLVGAARSQLVDEGDSRAKDITKRVSGIQLQASSLKERAWQIEDSLSFLESIARMRPLFWRDDHEPWNLLKMNDDPDDASSPDGSQGDSSGADEEGQLEDQQQTNSEEGQEAGDIGDAEGSENAEGTDGNSDNSIENGDESGDSNEASGADDGGKGNRPEDGSSDAGEGQSPEDGSSDAGEGEPPEDSAHDGEANTATEDARPDANAGNQTAASSSFIEATALDNEDVDNDTSESEGQACGFAPAFGDAAQADVYGYVEKDLQEIIDMARLSEIEWTDISKRIEADLKTMSSMRGYEAGTLMTNLALANRSRIDYADFLRRFSTAVEDANMSDEEFDYIYYMYGLNRYGNMPLVEPLESRETFRIRDFVIALDTSGSTTGELERLFVTRTLELLKQSAHRGEEVNIHIVQCDSKIRKVTVITDIQQLDAFEETVEVYGMGGTDFRPVFTYVDDLLQQGYFGNLRGLLYFTDGMGVFPSSPPSYDTAFVFVEDEGKEMKVPPWAMRVVLDEDMIREW